MQVIGVIWTKAERGGAGARRRNAIPTAAAIPAVELKNLGGQLSVEDQSWHWGNGFAAPMSMLRYRAPPAEAVVAGYTFEVDGAFTPPVLRVTYRADRHVGAPRHWYIDWITGVQTHPVHTFLLRPGEWGRHTYNERHSCMDTGDWWYEQHTFNVAWFDGPPDGRVFVDQPPVKEIVKLRRLR